MKANIKTNIIIIIFTAFTALMCLLYIFMPKSSFSETEKRYLQTAPDISFENIKSGKFSADFEKFLADQTPMRKFFISVNAYFELLKGNNGSNGIYLGKDGYLIEKPFDRKDRFDTNMKRILSFTEKAGEPVTLVSVPSKGYILSDKLPCNSLEYSDKDYSERLKSISENTFKYIDLIDIFKSSAGETQIYYKTDHHWTSDGAFLAYREICKQMNLKTPDINNYNIETYHGFYGTSYSKACYTLTKPDDVKLYINKKTNGKADITITEGKKETKSDNLFFKNHLDEGDKYLTFLDGNHSKVTIKTGNSGGRLLLIKDSFAHCLAPFLSEQYSEIVMVDLRYFKKGLTELIKEENITDIMLLYSIENLATSRDIIFS